MFLAGKKLTYQYVATARHAVVGASPPNGSLLFDFTVEVTVSDQSPEADLKVKSKSFMQKSLISSWTDSLFDYCRLQMPTLCLLYRPS